MASPENSNMHPVAGVVNKLVVAIPFVLVTGLGLHTSSTFEPYQFVANSPTKDQAISAYIPIVKKTEKAFYNRFFASESVSNALADEWISGSESGLLKTLRPISLDDTSREGVKAEIVRDCTLCAESLNYIALSKLKLKEYAACEAFAIKAGRLMQTVRFFDFGSLGSSSLEQRKSMEMLASAYSHLSPAQQAVARNAVAALEAKPETVRKMMEQVRFLALERSGDVRVLDSYFAMLKESPSRHLEQVVDRRPYANLEDAEVSDALNEFRLGLGSVLSTNLTVCEFAKSGKTGSTFRMNRVPRLPGTPAA